MTSRWAALVMVLALGVFVPRLASPQGGGAPQPGRQRGTGLVLGQNYPNPFGPETRIPFVVGDPPKAPNRPRPRSSHDGRHGRGERELRPRRIQ